MLFSYGSGQQRIDDNKKCRRIDGNFDCHCNAAVRRGAFLPMEHIRGFTRSHWMPPSVKCLHRITPVAAMVKEFESNTQKNKQITQLLAQLSESSFSALGQICPPFLLVNFFFSVRGRANLPSTWRANLPLFFGAPLFISLLPYNIRATPSTAMHRSPHTIIHPFLSSHW